MGPAYGVMAPLALLDRPPPTVAAARAAATTKRLGRDGMRMSPQGGHLAAERLGWTSSWSVSPPPADLLPGSADHVRPDA